MIPKSQVGSWPPPLKLHCPQVGPPLHCLCSVWWTPFDGKPDITQKQTNRPQASDSDEPMLHLDDASKSNEYRYYILIDVYYTLGRQGLIDPPAIPSPSVLGIL